MLTRKEDQSLTAASKSDRVQALAQAAQTDADRTFRFFKRFSGIPQAVDKLVLADLPGMVRREIFHQLPWQGVLAAAFLHAAALIGYGKRAQHGNTHKIFLVHCSVPPQVFRKRGRECSRPPGQMAAFTG